MTSLKVKAGSKFNCPHCGKPQDGIIDDYALIGVIGPRGGCDEQCGYCDTWYNVTQTTPGIFTITPGSLG